jgi:nicotinamidase-related amidase
MAELTSTFNPADPSTPGHYGPSQTALVLLDFHHVVIHKNAGPKAPAALEVAIKMRTWALSKGIQIIHALVNTTLEPFPTSKDIERFKLIISSIKGNSGGDEAPELLQGGPGNEVTFARRPGHISAFKSPGLSEFLQEKGIKSLIITGLATSGVVLRTALAGADDEYVVTVLSDACADPVEETHDFWYQKCSHREGTLPLLLNSRKDLKRCWLGIEVCCLIPSTCSGFRRVLRGVEEPQACIQVGSGLPV